MSAVEKASRPLPELLEAGDDVAGLYSSLREAFEAEQSAVGSAEALKSLRDRWLGRKNGLLTFTTVKTGMLCELEVDGVDLPKDRMTFVLTEDGAPFASDKALSQRVAKWFRQAGVNGVTAHGVRKWLASKMAEEGATEYQLCAYFGWRDPKEARPYVQAASRRRLASEASRKRGNV